MSIQIRYFSKSKKGNTLKLANKISETLNIEALSVENNLEEEASILFLANAMYAYNIDKEVKQFLEDNKSKIKLLVNVNSSASGLSTLKFIKKSCDKLGIKVSDKEFHCKGSWININKGRPNEDDLKKLEEFVLGVING